MPCPSSAAAVQRAEEAPQRQAAGLLLSLAASAALVLGAGPAAAEVKLPPLDTGADPAAVVALQCGCSRWAHVWAYPAAAPAACNWRATVCTQHATLPAPRPQPLRARIRGQHHRPGQCRVGQGAALLLCCGCGCGCCCCCCCCAGMSTRMPFAAAWHDFGRPFTPAGAGPAVLQAVGRQPARQDAVGCACVQQHVECMSRL